MPHVLAEAGTGTAEPWQPIAAALLHITDYVVTPIERTCHD